MYLQNLIFPLEQSLTKKFERELDEQKKIIQNDSFLVDRIIQKERDVSGASNEARIVIYCYKGPLSTVAIK